MSGPLAWSHRVSDIAETGSSCMMTATSHERSAIAKALDILSCEAVKADYVIRPVGGGHYRMSGAVSARVTQNCVVTLEPVSQTIEEKLDLEFCPAGSLPEPGESEVEVLEVPDVEPIEHGSIEAGRIIFETLSAALDPYPRKEGARLDWTGPVDGSEAEATGPFAGLKRLKDEP